MIVDRAAIDSARQDEAELDGIALDVPNPSQYLEALRFRLRGAFPDWGDWTGLSEEIETRLASRPAAIDSSPPDPNELERVIGWSRQEVLGQLVDREWLVADTNEFSCFAEKLDATETVAATVRPFLCAAGACRLGAHLAEREGVEWVECSDLSYLSLLLGRLLTAGDVARLPATILRPRDHFEVAPDGRSLRRADSTPALHRSTAAAVTRMGYRATDAFALPLPIPGDTVLVPFLVDIFDRDRLTTLLIRICEAMAPGQRLLLVSSLTGDRPPGHILSPLRACGLRIHRLHLWELPYSFSYHGYGFVRRVFNTLAVEAVKTEATDRASIVATLRPVANEPVPGLRIRPYELSGSQAAAVEKAAALGRYDDLTGSLEDALGAALSRRVLAFQASRGGLCLRPRDSTHR